MLNRDKRLGRGVAPDDVDGDDDGDGFTEGAVADSSARSDVEVMPGLAAIGPPAAALLDEGEGDDDVDGLPLAASWTAGSGMR